MTRFGRTILVLLVTTTAACSSDPSTTAQDDAAVTPDGSLTEPDASPKDASTPDTTEDASKDDAETGPRICNSLVPIPAVVTFESVAIDPPLPLGGEVGDGTYVVTQAVRYFGAGGTPTPTDNTLTATVRILGQSAESVLNGQRQSATIATSGTIVTTTNTCPNTLVQQNGYTATPETLKIFIPRDNYTLVETFSRQ